MRSGLGVTRFARRGSASVTYEAVGDPAARTVVGLHDLLADRSALAPLREALLAAGYRVILPDMRGHGASAALSTKPYPMADLTADVLAVLDAEGAREVDLVGHGLGGAIALAVAEVAPGRVRSLTLLDPAVAGVLADDPDPAAREAAAAVREAARDAGEMAGKGLTDRALDRWLEPAWGRDWRARLDRVRLGAIKRHGGALGAILAAEGTHAPRAAGIPEITTPMLLLRAEQPSVAAGLVADRLAAAPAATVATLPGPAATPATDGASAPILAFLAGLP